MHFFFNLCGLFILCVVFFLSFSLIILRFHLMLFKLLLNLLLKCISWFWFYLVLLFYWNFYLYILFVVVVDVARSFVFTVAHLFRYRLKLNFGARYSIVQFSRQPNDSMIFGDTKFCLDMTFHMQCQMIGPAKATVTVPALEGFGASMFPVVTC